MPDAVIADCEQDAVMLDTIPLPGVTEVTVPVPAPPLDHVGLAAAPCVVRNCPVLPTASAFHDDAPR